MCEIIPSQTVLQIFDTKYGIEILGTRLDVCIVQLKAVGATKAGPAMAVLVLTFYRVANVGM